MKKQLPGFQECLRLMRMRDPQMQEDGFHLLRAQAHKYTQQLVNEVTRETNPGLRCWFLELLAEARDPGALPLFLEYLYSDETLLKTWAISGLKQINTKASRRALWEAGF
ncbi:hypothetical protein KDH_11700 [Dictyobacter sp. S3.2.2.5]|uniref:HEAT repeat domain-containing protein n=1 Tax=Dictyobacter halimunensis TaxID=3026934 RepID=A0ABQ6FPG7_9CHLR|nr:hypothetical protein KDH_11700 [Dictyobacter sp. S3.2.2.5]